jgi:hypothetical protein
MFIAQRDYEAAARRDGYTISRDGKRFVDKHGNTIDDDTGTIDATAENAWQTLCEAEGIDPHPTVDLTLPERLCLANSQVSINGQRPVHLGNTLDLYAENAGLVAPSECLDLLSDLLVNGKHVTVAGEEIVLVEWGTTPTP